jgi:hypothetical protein
MRNQRKAASAATQSKRSTVSPSTLERDLRRAITGGDDDAVRAVAQRAYEAGGRAMMLRLYWAVTPGDLCALRSINENFEGVGGWLR